MDNAIPLGKREVIDGRLRVYYYGYWVKGYEAPADTLLAKKHLIEALTRRLFNHVEHGLDELWGEPFKAFVFPIEEFYNSRYIKIAQSMQAIDSIRDELIGAVAALPAFVGIDRLVCDFANAAKVKCETLCTDAEIFDVWTSFVVSAERLVDFGPLLPEGAPLAVQQQAAQAKQLIAVEGTWSRTSHARASRCRRRRKSSSKVAPSSGVSTSVERDLLRQRQIRSPANAFSIVSPTQ